LLPENPGGCFADFLEFIYTGEMTIMSQTIAGLLKIAVFYDAASHVSIFRFFLREHATGFFRSEVSMTRLAFSGRSLSLCLSWRTR
jgi:hypothetical protein